MFFGKRELGNYLVKHYVIRKMSESVCVCVSVCCGRGLGMVARDGTGRRGTPGEGVQLWLAGSAATEVLRKALVVLSFELQ